MASTYFSWEGLLPREHGHARAEVRMILQIERHLARVIAIETGETILDVGGVTDLRGLSVADDVDADLALFPDDLVDRIVHDALELGAGVPLAVFALEEHVNDRLAAGQAPHMRGQDALGTQFQVSVPRSIQWIPDVSPKILFIRNLKQV